MRCPDCRKFASYNEEEPEIESLDNEGASVMASVRIVNTCAECGLELTQATLDMEQTDEAANTHLVDNEDHALDVRDDSTERTQRSEGSGRGQKTFYGASLSYVLKCKCGEQFKGSMSDDIQASSMDELI